MEGSTLAEVAAADELEAHSAQVWAADEVEAADGLVAALLEVVEEDEETPGVGFPVELLDLRLSQFKILSLTDCMTIRCDDVHHTLATGGSWPCTAEPTTVRPNRGDG